MDDAHDLQPQRVVLLPRPKLDGLQERHIQRMAQLKPGPNACNDVADDSLDGDGGRVIDGRPGPVGTNAVAQRVPRTSRVGFREAGSHSEQRMVKLRNQALTALNLGSPQIAAHAEPQIAHGTDGSLTETLQTRCTCLRRGGHCSCAEDVSWLRSKRRLEVPKYTPPYKRRVAYECLQQASSTFEGHRPSRAVAKGNDETECSCLRRSGRCTCAVDAQWLRRKRQCLVPYVAPHIRRRAEELERKTAEVAQAGQSSEVGTSTAAGANVRTLARHWESQLERAGVCCFNPLQVDGQVNVLDAERVTAECTESSFVGQGVKGLPVVSGGRYQFEIELLRDSAVVIGWSSAMSLPSIFDLQAYGYASDGRKVHGNNREEYGEQFGRAGDVIGALLAWSEDSGSPTFRISFALNGQELGTAFEVGGCSLDKGVALPLQPHVCQLPRGQLMHVRLRGSARGPCLSHPLQGYAPLAVVSDTDFCPFSRAVAIASAERAAGALTKEQLRSFHVPDSHIVELYDLPAESASDSMMNKLDAHLKQILALSSPGDAFAEAPWHVRLTSSSTALVAFRRPGHASRLTSEAPLPASHVAEAAEPIAARSVRHATAASREELRERRGGEAFRPQADLSAARRLIHGSLQSQMPLPHLVQEKNKCNEITE